MATFVGIGFSQKSNTTTAVNEASLIARRNAQQQHFDLVIFFSTVHYPATETLEAIRQNFKQARIIGTSTAGIILPERIETQGIGILAVKSTEIKCGVGCVDDLLSDNLSFTGSQLAQNTLKDFGINRRQLFLFFIDSLIENNAALIKGVRETLGTTVPLLGAGSSDDFQFLKTYQFCQDKALTHSAVGLLLGGEMKIGIGLKHGWKPLGKPRLIDQAEGHIIKSIDGQKAYHLLEEYFRNDIQHFRSKRPNRTSFLYPLGIYIEKDGEYLLRYVKNILSDGSLVCQGDVPAGSYVHIMIGNKDSAKQAAVEAATEVLYSLLGKQPKFFIVFESLSRYKLLGRGALLEIQMIREILGYTTPMVGMYSFGEIGPLKPIDYLGEPLSQNHMMMILGIS